MKVLLQRVSQANLSIDNKTVSEIKNGLLLFIGISHSDNYENIIYLTDKCLNLRIFEDQEGKMNLSVKDISGEILAVSQFTLYGNTLKGRRPGFDDAASPVKAKKLYNKFVDELKKSELKIKTGVFGANMKINLTNDGPVTFMLENN